VFVGYILNYAYSLDRSGWEHMFDLVFAKLCAKLRVVTLGELLEG